MKRLLHMAALARRSDCPYSYDSLRRLAKQPERYGLEDVVSQPIPGGRVLFDVAAWERWISARRVVLPSVERADDVARVGA